MEKKYMHIASFAGNIGDLVNHAGFYDSFGIQEAQVEQIEMRRFYKNCDISSKLSFDTHLIDKINESKMLILGGGGFFDIRWDDSNTGTTIDMTKDFIDSIKVPVFVNAMGVHFNKDKKRAIDNFFEFFNYIKKQENWFITVRNDGSLKRLQSLYGKDIINGIRSVPDNGFMVGRGKLNETGYRDRKCIGLSITNELLIPEYSQGVTLDQFNSEISTFITDLLKHYCCIFFLHGPQDFSTIMRIQDKIGMEQFRKNIITAPYFPFGGKRGGVAQLLQYYNMCDAIIGMRFHSNIIAISQNIPIVGLAIHEMISSLYEEIQYGEHCVKVGEYKYMDKLKELFKHTIDKNDTCRLKEQEIMQEVLCQHKSYVKATTDFISSLKA